MSKFKVWAQDNVPYIIVVILMFLLVVVMLWSRIFILVRPGEAGVLYRMLTTGTVTDQIYSEGLHILSPLDEMHRYDARVQVIFHEIDVLTSRGLPIKLSLAVRFKPIYELLGILHQQVGPDYPNKIILPQIESVLRRKIGNYTPEDIYTNREGVLSKIITLALEEVGRKYIEVDEIIIRSVQLPDSVRQSIEDKLVEEQRFLAYDFKLKIEEAESNRKKIEATGYENYHKIISNGLDDKILQWHGIQATMDLSKSNNSKIILIGSGKQGLPIILNAEQGSK